MSNLAAIRWLGLALAALSALAACSAGTPSVTLQGRVRPPSSEGISQPAALPARKGSPLTVANLAGTLGKADAATVTNDQGDFSFDVRTDALSEAGDWVKVAWRHPGRGGPLLARTFRLTRGQTGTIQGDLTDLSTLVSLALEAERQLDASRLLDATGKPRSPQQLENELATQAAGTGGILGTFQQRFYGYLAGGATPPGADSDLAQDAVELLFPKQ
ncbi:MAG TPA: hypothetical protein V6D00_09595 [Pantanalinema sp.]